ncbi:MAG TPA: lipid-A-disaccharide synthase N-terminal domain-containing protein [Phycisphaerales bacterium]|nr:lipid-A-disaccharide synthase N-terminal domain-containing protein [Phycisphaerales bacterium]
MKWEPAALMVLVLGLGLWLALGPGSRPKFDTRPGATTVDVRIGDNRGVLERGASTGSPGEPTYRLIMRGAKPSREMSSAEVVSLLGREVVDETSTINSNWIFKTLRITNWVGVAWVTIGLAGQLAFSGRMVLQWFVSERRKESVITESFWWFSLFGALMLFSYFVWRQDPVGILGQASGIVIYARNIRLIHKKRRRAVRDEERRLAAEASLSAAAVAESTRDLAAMSRPASAGAAESREVHTAGAGRG